MNGRQLQKLGVPEECVREAITAIQFAISSRTTDSKQVKAKIKEVLDAPEAFLDDDYFAKFAQAIIDDRNFVRAEPVAYETWGKSGIDQESHFQMRQACSVPVAVAGALMPDAHVGYGLPIGGVLACDNAVIPYAVGVDIACRMKLSVLDIAADAIDSQFNRFKEALEGGTRFGVGKEYQKPQAHAVMDADWSITRITREKKDRAWKQLGTSGSGNHFVEFGLLTLTERDEELNLDAGQYVALLSHSGSRGAGAAVCSTYSAIAQAALPKKYEDLGRLAWLDLESEAGQEYWAAMNLMGDYAAANHDVIHRQVSKLLGSQIIAGVENHHNFAWKETHGGKEVIVHRKGATPAAAGELGVIPGSMADPAFVVRGKGNAASLGSASHGAGRQMSRTKARDKFSWKAVKNDLEKKGVRVLSAGADEVPGAYKDIRQVMNEQADLVDIVARFDPRIVKMCDDGSKAED
ncbi:RtcB family protein [Blastopirellula marina]|uniref:3'-phosphate/5'-hydroxy nucleic acid ligase n=1 Tax=Blastopirellula marina DSM 3645 TaxID=314230 RepID=A3ZWI3_9BACT|nr:RtcB family protein [Blastopirellula marina]EAQ79211.1 RtcB protein [Blastopirellula marina DSM 3645]